MPTAETRALVSAVFPGEYDDLCPVPRDLPVVAVSAHAMRGDMERFLAAGMDFYLSKPVNMEALKDVLQKIAMRLSMQEQALADTYVARR